MREGVAPEHAPHPGPAGVADMDDVQRGLPDRLAQGRSSGDAHHLVKAAARIAGRDEAGRRHRPQAAGLARIEPVGDAVRAGQEVIVQRQQHRHAGPEQDREDARRQAAGPLVQVDAVGPVRQGREGAGEAVRRLAAPDPGERRRHGRAAPGIGEAEIDPGEARMLQERVGLAGHRLDVGDRVAGLGEAAGGFQRDLLGAAARHRELRQDDDVHGAPARGLSAPVSPLARSRPPRHPQGEGQHPEVYGQSTAVR
ncbi:hypothetical protein AEGHOMDF_6140 [Methylobacterium soli]|nr:hypothetical protein AEGHOMDF_6140 [Methylobacterium soli]